MWTLVKFKVLYNIGDYKYKFEYCHSYFNNKRAVTDITTTLLDSPTPRTVTDFVQNKVTRAHKKFSPKTPQKALDIFKSEKYNIDSIQFYFQETIIGRTAASVEVKAFKHDNEIKYKLSQTDVFEVSSAYKISKSNKTIHCFTTALKFIHKQVNKKPVKSYRKE